MRGGMSAAFKVAGRSPLCKARSRLFARAGTQLVRFLEAIGPHVVCSATTSRWGDRPLGRISAKRETSVAEPPH